MTIAIHLGRISQSGSVRPFRRGGYLRFKRRYLSAEGAVRDERRGMGHGDERQPALGLPVRQGSAEVYEQARVQLGNSNESSFSVR